MTGPLSQAVAALHGRVARGEDVEGIDALAQEIRRVEGNHSLGAGALAEALWPFVSAIQWHVEKPVSDGAFGTFYTCAQCYGTGVVAAGQGMEKAP